MSARLSEPAAVGPVQQAISASAGSVLTSLTSTPLEVVKVRQQQATGQPDSRALLVRIAREEGVSTLWSGLRPTLLMSIPSTVLYLTLYEAARDELARPSSPLGPWAPLVAGGSARLVASTLVSPLELLRTRMQAAGAESPGAGGLRSMAADVVRRGGVAALWGGLVPTLWRDVPFSCMYWLCYESLRKRAAQASPTGEVSVVASFGAGAAAGMAAAAATTPLDVVKTRQQLSASGGGGGEGTAQALTRLVRTEGGAALFAGLGPRLAKVVPSCAIMIASYEAGKKLFARRRPELAAPPPPPAAAAAATIGSGLTAVHALAGGGLGGLGGAGGASELQSGLALPRAAAARVSVPRFLSGDGTEYPCCIGHGEVIPSCVQMR